VENWFDPSCGGPSKERTASGGPCSLENRGLGPVIKGRWATERPFRRVDRRSRRSTRLFPNHGRVVQTAEPTKAWGLGRCCHLASGPGPLLPPESRGLGHCCHLESRVLGRCCHPESRVSRCCYPKVVSGRCFRGRSMTDGSPPPPGPPLPGPPLPGPLPPGPTTPAVTKIAAATVEYGPRKGSRRPGRPKLAGRSIEPRPRSTNPGRVCQDEKPPSVTGCESCRPGGPARVPLDHDKSLVDLVYSRKVGTVGCLPTSEIGPLSRKHA
jgi:hypothetical protein